MRVIVCGGRHYSNQQKVWSILRNVEPKITTIITGAASGADIIAEGWARAAQIDYEGHPAKWHKDGRAAGPIRNQEMLDYRYPDLVIAFPGGRGTADMVRRANKAGVNTQEVPE